MKCHECNGTGEVPDAERPALTAGRFCPAERDVGHARLTCLIEGHHDGPHMGYEASPCRCCGAMDQHTDWCPEREFVTKESCDVAFDDEGWYWLPTPIEAPFCWRFDATQSDNGYAAALAQPQPYDGSSSSTDLKEKP